MSAASRFPGESKLWDCPRGRAVQGISDVRSGPVPVRNAAVQRSSSPKSGLVCLEVRESESPFESGAVIYVASLHDPGSSVGASARPSACLSSCTLSSVSKSKSLASQRLPCESVRVSSPQEETFPRRSFLDGPDIDPADDRSSEAKGHVPRDMLWLTFVVASSKLYGGRASASTSAFRSWTPASGDGHDFRKQAFDLGRPSFERRGNPRPKSLGRQTTDACCPAVKKGRVRGGAVMRDKLPESPRFGWSHCGAITIEPKEPAQFSRTSLLRSNVQGALHLLWVSVARCCGI